MSLIKSYNNLLNNNSLNLGHVRNASTSPKRIQLKDQIIQQLSTLMSLELNKIDTRDIETKLSIYFNINENDEASTYVKSLCTKISEIKTITITKVKTFLNHNISYLIENSINNNNNYVDNNTIENYNYDIDSIKNKYKSILKEVKILNNNSRIKYKKLYDSLSNEYDKILSTIYDYIQKNNTKLILDRLSRIEQIKNDILIDVSSIENIQNKFSDSIKNIINKDNLSLNVRQKENNSNKAEFSKTTLSLGRTRTGKYNFRKRNNTNLDSSDSFNTTSNYLSQSEFDLFNKSYNYRTITNANNDEKEIIKLYRVKIKEKKNEIEKLKQQLQQEKESKNKVVNELNKLQYSNKMSLSMKNSQKNWSDLEKFNKLTEMIIGFTYSMNNLRNSLYQKTISHMDAKNIYGQLKNKLISLIEEAYTLKKNISNNDENSDKNKKMFMNDVENNDYEEDNNNNNEENDIKTIKEENESSQLLTERESSKNINANNNNNQLGNVVNNNITLNTLSNFNIEALLEENKKLRNQLAEKIINSENINYNNNQENSENKDNINNNNYEIYKNQIIELKKIIMEKDEEIEKIRNDLMQNQKDELNNIIQNNTNNLEQLKTVYQLLIDGKDNRIKELEEEILSYEKEIELLKDENNNLKIECRKDKILSEHELNNLKNQKIELQCMLEQGGGGNTTLLNLTSITNSDNSDKEKIIKLENEIKIKNKQIMLLTQNHENDLKELNLAIEMLKQKISQLEEENICLSERNKKENKSDDN